MQYCREDGQLEVVRGWNAASEGREEENGKDEYEENVGKDKN